MNLSLIRLQFSGVARTSSELKLIVGRFESNFGLQAELERRGDDLRVIGGSLKDFPCSLVVRWRRGIRE
jgi:hypothetical protein